jgi:hypothetical protein
VQGLIVVVPCCASLFDGGCIGDSQRSYLSNEERFAGRFASRLAREKSYDLRRLSSVDVGSKRNCFEFRNEVVYRRKEKRRRLFVYRRTVKTSGVDGLQVDLEEESSKGNYHVGGKFRSQKGLSIT